MSRPETTARDELVRHLATGEPAGAQVEQLARATAPELVAALFALAPDEQVRAVWSRAVGFEEASVLGKIAFVSSEQPDVETVVDQMLASGQAAGAVAALARAGVAWQSPHIVELLDTDASRQAAAMVLAAGQPEALADWAADCEVVEDALDGLRAAALEGRVEVGEVLLGWQEALGELDDADAERARVDGLLATIDPLGYARRVLGGDSDIGWLADLPMVADFLQVHGPTSWLEVLGVLEATDHKALELACLLAVSAAAAVGFEPPSDEQAAELIELLTVDASADSDDWEPLATRLGLGFAIAVAPDDDLGLLAAQIGAHERLLAFDIHSPGVPGLPLSATVIERLDLDRASALLEQAADIDSLPEATAVALVRTLCDLQRLADHDPQRFSQRADEFIDAFVGAASDGARPLLAAASPADDEALAWLEQHGRVQGPLGLACARRLAADGSEQALAALARLWESGPVYRAAFYRDALLEAVRYG